tara:strand:- start:2857 stop:3822 length:966 start_codon:yes stop_codon:yes gene_type:complete
MATSSSYCTHRDLKDVFPQIDEYDVKTPVYGWVVVSGSKYASHNSGLVTQLFVDGESLGPAQSAHTDLNVEGEWFYNSTDDVLYYYSDSTPEDKLMEAGELFSTLITRVIDNASRYFDSRVDARLPRDQWRDKEGNFDYMVVRTTAMIAAYFLVNSREPGSPIATQLFEEINFNLERINTGQVKLSYQVSSDASKGVLREVTSPQNANPLHIVDTRGDYFGIYDLLKIIVTTGGAIGTSKFSVFGKDSDALKVNQIVTDKIINGQYQTIGNGLQIRFAGKNDSSVATANDEWELEVFGKYESMDESPNSGANTRMTRHRRR